ncbi:MAG: tetratricopeptide repeat protein [Tannerellaceae bacterium]|jgi:tetratricopeptide (TPR) repeat protein|nr:tetratricopeptide repeat protein [Tannerellaceae bacterium]
MGNFFKSLFPSSETEKSAAAQEKENRKKFDVFKYDGVRAQRIGQIPYAIKCFREALKIREDVEVLQFLAAACAAIHDADEALLATNRLVELEPDNAATLLSRASLFYQTDQGNEAMADCLRVLEMDASNPVAWYLAGRIRKNSGDLTGAADAFTKATDSKPDFVEACLMRAAVLLEMNRPEEALAGMESLAELAPEEEAVYRLRGRIHEALDDLPSAADDYNRAIALNPFNEETYLLKGALLLRERKWEEAIAFFDEVIELNPSFSEAYRGRAKAKAAMGGDVDGAAADRQKADELEREKEQEKEGEEPAKRPDFNDMYKGGIF